MAATPASSPHPLDNAVWSALSTCHAALSEGGALARRYQRGFAPFGAVAVPTPQAFAALASGMAAGDDVRLFARHAVEPGPFFDVTGHKDLVQMIGPVAGVVADPRRFVVLGDADRAQMHDLVERTEPGPFGPRSPELGRFLGFKAEGRMVAMAGERMHLTGHVEISAVCTDPAWRGRGLARDLMLLVGQAIQARGETPFLHVAADNLGAIALYERMGFARRATTRVTALRRNAAPAP
jgi:ribosomal protein S18 acetylase RimI-like enzyme